MKKHLVLVKKNQMKKSDEKSETKEVNVEAASDGGGDDSDMTIVSTTDNASRKSSESMLDTDAPKFEYSQIPKVDLKKVIVPTTEILDIFKEHYLNEKKEDSVYWDKTLEELNKQNQIVRKLCLIWSKNLR